MGRGGVACIHAHMRTCMLHAYTRRYKHSHVHTCVHTCVHLWMHAHLHVGMDIHMHMHRYDAPSASSRSTSSGGGAQDTSARGRHDEELCACRSGLTFGQCHGARGQRAADQAQPIAPHMALAPASGMGQTSVRRLPNGWIEGVRSAGAPGWLLYFTPQGRR